SLVVFTAKGVLLTWDDFKRLDHQGEYVLLTDKEGIAKLYHKSSDAHILGWFGTSDAGLSRNVLFLSDTDGVTRIYDYKGTEVLGYKSGVKSVRAFKAFVLLMDDKGTAKIVGRADSS